MASAAAVTTHQEGEYPDEDTFLTALESKLRGPFSSVELAKFITPLTTPMIARVLHRAEKVTQLRILTGLLGVSLEEEESLREIVKIAQTAPDYEEWVRVIAGIVQDKLQLGSSATTDTEEDGKEARKTLQDSCRDIIKRVREIERTSSVIDEDTEHLLGQSDIHPAFVPFHHFLDINPQSEANFSNDHFKVNQSADILHIDARLEKEKAKEEALHKQTAAISKSKTMGSSGPTGAAAATMPGSNGGAARKKPIRPAPKKASMFMPTKKKLGAPVQKTLLRKRKGAQALVSQGRNRTASSKTKLVNMDDVKNGLPEKQSLIPDLKRGRKMGGALKRKAEASAETPKVARPRVAPASPPNPSISSPSRTAARQQDWREMLEVRSNILTQQDRERIRQFFEDRTNPTPEVDSYRCKLHEERTSQEKTTYYIELDYKAFRSKQFSKIKRYS